MNADVIGRWIFWLALLVVGAEAARAQGRTTPNLVVKDAVGKTVASYQDSHALVIGVSSYTAGWPSLPNVTEEAREIRNALEGNGFKVRMVTDPDAKGLHEAFERFIKEFGQERENRLLFFFSGHGFTSNRNGFLAPSDAPELEGDGDGLRRKSLAMSQILAWCRSMKSRHALFLFDSCFFDTVFQAEALPKTSGRISALTGRPVRQFMSAGTAGELFPDKSVFARMIVRALRGDADVTKDGYITGTELGQYLLEKVNYYNDGQTPQYAKIRDPDLDEGDFVFLLPKALAPSAQDMYIPVFNTIVAADALMSAGQGRAALEKYLVAEWKLRKLKSLHQDWNPKIVNFRLRYLSDRIGPLQVRYPGTVIPAASAQ